jgi:hypothetical protein
MIPRQGYDSHDGAILRRGCPLSGQYPIHPCREVSQMPIHKVPRARLYEDSVSIEREGERIIQVMLDPDDDSRWFVITQWIHAGYETRGVS